MQTTSQHARVASVRAIPIQGHKRRWCGLERWVEDREHRPHPDEKHGLPWPATEVKVRVVDEPQPFDPNANGGVPIEIGPATFAMLERDERIAVRMIDGGEGDSAEAMRAKGEIAKLEDELADARRELAHQSERFASMHTSADAQARDLGAKLAATEHELAAARAQLQQAQSQPRKK